ncbi:MAG: hypothetical protein IJC78_05130 [Clostridia bacterium]|nr:hypothetical protein [Clostridia bacterium]
MSYIENWIWLPGTLYPEKQTTKYSAFLPGMEESYAVAEFQRTYRFGKVVEKALLRFSGDTEFCLELNGKVIATGPATVEGDFVGNEKPRPNFYATELSVAPNRDTLAFYALVKQMPVRICEYSMGHGGFMLTGEIVFSDGTKTVICTDESWQVRLNGAYTKPFYYDGRIKPDAYVSAEVVRNIWKTTTAPLAVRTEQELIPEGEYSIVLASGEKRETELELPMIYAGFLHVVAETEEELEAEIVSVETVRERICETFVFSGYTDYRSLQLHSAGKLIVRAKNNGEKSAKLTVTFIETHYPILQEAKTVTSDEELNQLLSVSAHALKICRQLHHLDSPAHVEPLACTGDYYIETLMNLFAYGDMSLSAFDVQRTAELLRHNDGRMFHTTYSLIWVRMLYDVYMITGNKSLLKKCEDALVLLLNRFETYIGENGLIETPPDFMFVDWIYIDGLSMHHPPKALGQTVLNLFYFSALGYAAKVFEQLGEPAMASDCLVKQKKLQMSVNTLLYDAEKGLYFEGLNTKTPEDLLYEYMPQNVEKRYYLPQSNILAAYVGICDRDTACKLIDKVMSGACNGDYQPYFAHFLMEAIFENGMRETYTLKELEKWKPSIKECSKGLVEGFHAPEPTYQFDHSHAWAGTPLYSLPRALLGLRILKPGMKELSLSPSLLGLEYAKVELTTPYGMVVCEWDEQGAPHITHPEEIKIHMK